MAGASARKIAAAAGVNQVVDITGLASLITAAFVGLELYDGANLHRAKDAETVLSTLTSVVDSFLSAGAASSRVIARTLRQAARP